MSSPAAASGAKRLTFTEWLICIMAAIGFAFDIYELLMLPLILGPSLLELKGATPGTPTFQTWASLMFWVPAIAGTQNIMPAHKLKSREPGVAPGTSSCKLGRKISGSMSSS